MQRFQKTREVLKDLFQPDEAIFRVYPVHPTNDRGDISQVKVYWDICCNKRIQNTSKFIGTRPPVIE